ncbi:MAG: hypothetical protein ACJ731_00645 [Vicinamibacterales bacterium]
MIVEPAPADAIAEPMWQAMHIAVQEDGRDRQRTGSAVSAIAASKNSENEGGKFC